MPWTSAVTRTTGYGVTAAVWNSEHVDNMNFLKEVAYTQFTGNVSSTAITVGTAGQFVSAGAITYEDVPHLIEFYCPRFAIGAAGAYIILRDGTTVLGVLDWIEASAKRHAVYVARRLTPTAASHTYNIAAWLQAAGTITAEAGSGGAAGDNTAELPGFLRITRIPT